METQKTLADLSAHCLARSRRTASEKKCILFKLFPWGSCSHKTPEGFIAVYSCSVRTPRQRLYLAAPSAAFILQFMSCHLSTCKQSSAQRKQSI